ncbi:MAG: nucleoside hydrolase [Thermomicrobiales bacterium]
MSERMPLILDVDTGTDDALALAYAVENPNIELVATTTVAGNIGVELATANTLAVLDFLGATDVPVHKGASHPLARPHRDAVYFHHENGMGGAQLPKSTREIGPDRGPAAIIRLAKQRPGEITLVCLGPLTNLAIALNVEPGLTDLLAGVALMGGAFHVPGNTTPAAEFNILVDPEAAEQVFAAPFKRLIAVGLDVTEQVRLVTADWEHSRDNAGTLPPAAALLGEVGRYAYGELGRESFALHDPLAVASALQPELVSVEDSAIAVESTGDETGQTRIMGPGRVGVALAVDAERALRDFRETVGLPA